MARQSKFNTMVLGRGVRPCAVVVDGLTEILYFNQMRAFERISIKPVEADGSIEAQFQQVQQLHKKYSVVYWLIDYDVVARDNRDCNDESRKQLTLLKGCLSQASHMKWLHVLFNSPCLEYWLLLHYDPANRRAYEQYEGELETALRKLMPDYAKTKKYYESALGVYLKLRPQLPTAVAAARSLHGFNPQAGHCAPVADVWQIISDLNIV